MLAAWTMIDDPTVAAKMQEIAPDAPPGSQEAIDAHAQATADLDFDSSDGIDGQNTYAGKGLNYLEGGRKQYLIDKIEVSGKTEAEATEIARRHFNLQVRTEFPDAQYNTSWGDRVQAFADKYQGTAGPARAVTAGPVTG